MLSELPVPSVVLLGLALESVEPALPVSPELAEPPPLLSCEAVPVGLPVAAVGSGGGGGGGGGENCTGGGEEAASTGGRDPTAACRNLCQAGSNEDEQ